MVHSSEKEKIFEAFFEDVLFEGWHEGTLEKAAEKAGFDRRLARHYFPSGIASILAFLSERADCALKEEVKKNLQFSEMRVHEKIAALVKMRLMAYYPYREALKAYGAHLIFPSELFQATQFSFQTVDLIWRLAGDKSTDFNYYSKRAILWFVYSSTALFWLQDHSENFKESWDFLDRRIKNILHFGRVKTNIKDKMTKNLFACLKSPSYFLEALERE